MAEEYIKKSEMEKLREDIFQMGLSILDEYREFFKRTKDLPTHSFESLGYVEIMLKVAPIIAEGLQVDFPVLVIAENVTESVCQHFKKAEGDYPLVCMPRQFGKDTKSRILMQYNLERLGVGEKFLLLTPRGEYLFKKIPVPKKKPANIKIYYDEFVKVLDKEVK